MTSIKQMGMIIQVIILLTIIQCQLCLTTTFDSWQGLKKSNSGPDKVALESGRAGLSLNLGPFFTPKQSEKIYIKTKQKKKWRPGK